MLTTIKGLFTSKKFWMVMLGSVLVTVMTQMGMSADMIAWVGGLFGVGVLGQGLSDFGKGAK